MQSRSLSKIIYFFKDINECAVDPTICGDGGTCVNADGYYICYCDPGYAGGGGPGIGGVPESCRGNR